MGKGMRGGNCGERMRGGDCGKKMRGEDWEKDEGRELGKKG